MPVNNSCAFRSAFSNVEVEFAVTKAGDLRPARLASVYLIGGLTIPPDSAVSVILDKQLSERKNLENQDRWQKTRKNYFVEKASSHHRFSAGGSQVVEENKEYSEFLSTRPEIEPEGFFRIATW